MICDVLGVVDDQPLLEIGPINYLSHWCHVETVKTRPPSVLLNGIAQTSKQIDFMRLSYLEKRASKSHLFQGKVVVQCMNYSPITTSISCQDSAELRATVVNNDIMCRGDGAEGLRRAAPWRGKYKRADRAETVYQNQRHSSQSAFT